MTAEDETPAPFDEIAVTHTAKSKAFRYLSESELRAHVADPEIVYYRPSKSPWLIPVDRPRQGREQHEPPTERITIVVTVDEDTAVVVTQTGEHDHYAWEDYREVEAVGVVPDPDETTE